MKLEVMRPKTKKKIRTFSLNKPELISPRYLSISFVKNKDWGGGGGGGEGLINFLPPKRGGLLERGGG